MNLAYILFTYFALFLLGLIDNARGPVYPELLRFFSIDKSIGSFIFSIASFSGFFISIFSDSWLKKFGPLKATRIALVLDILACFLMASVEGNRLGLYQFFLAQFLLGLGMGFKGITLNLIIKEVTNINNRRKIYAGLHSMYGIASFLAPAILSYLFEAGISWKVFFYMVIILPTINLLFSLKLSDTIEIKTIDKDQKLPTSYLIPIALVFSFYVCSEILVSSRLVVYLEEVHQYPLAKASGILSYFFISLLIGRLFFAFITIKLQSIHLLKISLISSLVVTLLGLLVYPPILALNGLTMSFFFPCGMDWISQSFKNNSDHIIPKVMMTIGGFLVAMHWGFGQLSEIFGLNYSIWLIPVFLVISLYILQFKSKSLA